ncbi:MAG: hypothetical protein MPW15_04265 [Candidatus Manganitrophus sp.]|nr:hypothetical protein [Candidatus Manganitrophus sp.]
MPENGSIDTYMKRALRLARKGRGKTSPNPMVGAVIVKNGAVVGEGFHPGPGAPHAEVIALNQAELVSGRREGPSIPISSPVAIPKSEPPLHRRPFKKRSPPGGRRHDRSESACLRTGAGATPEGRGWR